MKNKCKFLFIMTVVAVLSFYRVDFSVAMAAEQKMEPELITGSDVESESDTEPAAGDETGADACAEPDTKPAAGEEAEADAEPEPDTKPAAGEEAEADAEPEPDTKPAAGEEAEAGAEPEPDVKPAAGEETEADAEPEPDAKPAAGDEAEPDMEPAAAIEAEAAEASLSVMKLAVEADSVECISDGQDLIEWLELHKNTGGTVKLADDIVLDGFYSFCPNGRDMPAVFVDTDRYTITVTGEIELLSDNHLFFSGEPDGKSIFYVSPNGMLSMEGIVVESGQCALWQEEGAGLAVFDCTVSGSIHYADTPYVMYYNNVICAVVEKGQTLNDVLPAQINCTVNRQGQMSCNEKVSVSWDLEGTEQQQEERRRFIVQGSFLDAMSAVPAQCTVIYNDAPLTFTHVKATINGCLYTFQGGFTVPEESLPFTVMAEYSYDGENWFLYEEQSVNNTNAGFYIACKSEPVSRAACLNIYIRLQWNDNGTRYFSNVLCYATNDLEAVEDIGGGRGGGTSIVNPPETPIKSTGGVSSEETETGRDTNRNAESKAAESEAASDTKKTETAGGEIDTGTSANAEQPINTESVDADAEQPVKSKSVNADAEQPVKSKSVNADAEQSVISESVSVDAGRQLNTKISSNEEKSPLYAEAKVQSSYLGEQTLYADTRRSKNIVIVAGAVALSVIAGAAGFCVHSLLGTKR